MKTAGIADTWRAIRKSNKRSVRRLYLRWSGIPRLTDGEINLVQPITLICGENGAGKSSILHAMVQAIDVDDVTVPSSPYCRPRVGRIEAVEIEIASSQNSIDKISGQADVSSYFFPASGESRLAFIDAGMHVPAILKVIKGDANFSDFLEGVDPIVFKDDVLAQAKFIVGRDYTKISVYEIADSPIGGVLPYFEVESHGVSYGAIDMGYGEISVVYFLWCLNRLDSGAILFIEEPEAFLSPRAQTALVDVIALYTKLQNISVVMTSHSGAIAARMINSEIIYASRSSGAVVFHSPARTSDLVERLGLVPEKSFIIFVEDKAGEIFARTLIDNYSDRLSSSSEFVVSGGDANVLRALEAIPENIKSVAHLGLLDGDQRNQDFRADSRVVFLPGTSPPEVVLKSFFMNLHVEEKARELGVQLDDVIRALAHTEGAELHDWWHILARNLNIPYLEVIRRAVLLWAKGNIGEVEKFIADLEGFSSAVSG